MDDYDLVNTPDPIWLQIVAVVLAIICLIGFLIAYFLPYILGRNRGITSSGFLFFLNLTMGWTVVGWFACFAWAMSARIEDQRTIRN